MTDTMTHEQTTWKPLEQECPDCGAWVYMPKTTKHQKTVVLETEPFAERKALKRFRLSREGASYIDIHSQLSGEEGYPFHICKPRMTLLEAIQVNPDLGELHEAMRAATFANPYDEAKHEEIKARFHARCSELGVFMGKPNMGFDAHQREPEDPQGWRPQGSGFQEAPDARLQDLDTKMGEQPR